MSLADRVMAITDASDEELYLKLVEVLSATFARGHLSRGMLTAVMCELARSEMDVSEEAVLGLLAESEAAKMELEAEG